MSIEFAVYLLQQSELFFLPVLAHHNDWGLQSGNAGQDQVHQDKGVRIEFVHTDSQCVENDPDRQDDAKEDDKPPASTKLRNFVREFLPPREGFQRGIGQIADDKFLGSEGYKEEGTITTAFDMTVLNELDRFHLAMDVLDRVPQLGNKGSYLKQQLMDKLIEHKRYINQNGEDMPEIRNWKWHV